MPGVKKMEKCMKNSYITYIGAVLALCWIPTSTQADVNSYTCKILQAIEMTNDGHMQKHKGMWKSTIGKTFTVNRNTGEMIGHPFSTEGWLGGIKVLNRGGNGNSYKAMVISGAPNISIKYIHIAEYSEPPYKPFWGNGDDDVIFSGLCE